MEAGRVGDFELGAAYRASRWSAVGFIDGAAKQKY
jgi:hypothetical protein